MVDVLCTKTGLGLATWVTGAVVACDFSLLDTSTPVAATPRPKRA